MLIETRNLARHPLTLPQPAAPDAAGLDAVADTRAFVLALAGFAASMRNQLRAQPAGQGLDGLLPEELLRRLPGLRHAPQAVGLRLAHRLRDWRSQRRLGPELALPMEQALDRLMGLLGGCERIANTPLPFTYSGIESGLRELLGETPPPLPQPDDQYRCADRAGLRAPALPPVRQTFP